MDYLKWVAEIDQLLDGTKISAKARDFIFREAYYDGFAPEEAVSIATDPSVTYRQGAGWLKARRGRKVLNP